MPITEKNPDGTYTVTYQGAVLADREMNGYDDSDFYALCWDADKQDVVRITYASTRYAGGGRCTVDADDELRLLVARTLTERRLESFPSYLAAARSRVRKGAPVAVVGGRKHNGRTGTAFWIGETVNSYTRRPEARCGVLADNGDRFFVPLAHVAVTAHDDTAVHADAVAALEADLKKDLSESGCRVPLGAVWSLVETATARTAR